MKTPSFPKPFSLTQTQANNTASVGRVLERKKQESQGEHVAGGCEGVSQSSQRARVAGTVNTAPQRGPGASQAKVQRSGSSHETLGATPLLGLGLGLGPFWSDGVM